MKKLAIVIAVTALMGTPAFAADMAVKAAPPAPPPVPTWTGFYGGIQFGGGWGGDVSSSPNDPLAAELLSGGFGVTGEQPVVTSFSLKQSGAVGGVEAGYNWQWGSNWLVGLEADFSASGLNGQASGTSILEGPPATVLHSRSMRRRPPTGMAPFEDASAGSQHLTFCCLEPVDLLTEGSAILPIIRLTDRPAGLSV